MNTEKISKILYKRDHHFRRGPLTTRNRHTTNIFETHTRTMIGGTCPISQNHIKNIHSNSTLFFDCNHFSGSKQAVTLLCFSPASTPPLCPVCRSPINHLKHGSLINNEYPPITPTILFSFRNVKFTLSTTPPIPPHVQIQTLLSIPRMRMLHKGRVITEIDVDVNSHSKVTILGEQVGLKCPAPPPPPPAQPFPSPTHVLDLVLTSISRLTLSLYTMIVLFFTSIFCSSPKSKSN